MANELPPDMKGQPILIAEDNHDHVLLLRRALQKRDFPHPIFVVNDGEETITYLDGAGKFANRYEYPLPALLLLDLKMPGKNGFEVLEWIRQQPGLKRLRIVVLTTWDSPQDVNRAYELGANAFMVKPFDKGQYLQFTDAIIGYWLSMSAAPDLQHPHTDHVSA
jgi:CheY-like chemotaxis protein